MKLHCNLSARVQASQAACKTRHFRLANVSCLCSVNIFFFKERNHEWLTSIVHVCSYLHDGTSYDHDRSPCSGFQALRYRISVTRREAGVGWLSLASSLMKDPVWHGLPLRLLLCHGPLYYSFCPRGSSVVYLFRQVGS